MDNRLTPSRIYTPLSKDEIRLAVLRRYLPPRRAIQVDLLTSRWPPSQPYEALSYVWGDQAIQSTILVSVGGGGPRRRCPVTRNLYAALQHLRRGDSDRLLWIDALCIDQANLDEKEQ
jgi:hypothetical protein